MATQNQKILRHLEDYGSIDPVVAMKEYGIMRLAARISDLKAKGHAISAETTKGINRYGEPVHYATYYLRRGSK